MSRLALAFFVWTVLVAAALGQSRQPGTISQAVSQAPARAAPLPGAPEKGTSIIRGQVVAADSGAPVRRAHVMAMGDTPQRRSGVLTDADGRFEIRELPAGRYTLMASKAGFVSSGMEEAGRVPRRPTVEVGEGQAIEKLVIALQRGGVITGRVVDEFGEPVAGAEVMAMVPGFRDGRRQPVPAPASSGGMTRSDDLGAFRIFGLPSGAYIVSARPPRDFGMMDAGPPEGLAASYYPGTPDMSQAQRVTLKAGQELSNVSFALVRQRLARVSGTAINSRGEPFTGAMVMVGQNDPFLFFSGGGGTVRADGSFVVNGLAPGAYTLTVRGPTMGDDGEIGMLPITVTGEDIDGLLIVASRGGILRGRISTDEGPIPPDARALTIMANPIEGELRVMGAPGRGQIREDGSFEVKGLFGRRRVNVMMMGSPSPWFVKGVFVDGEDVTDQGIDFSSDRVIDSAEIVLTRKITEITGRVTDGRGRPPASATVIVFPFDDSRRGPQSRYVRAATADQDGRFHLRGLPPYDDYLVIAVSGIESGQWTDADFLRALADEATRLSLAEGEAKVQDLWLKPVPGQ